MDVELAVEDRRDPAASSGTDGRGVGTVIVRAALGTTLFLAAVGWPFLRQAEDRPWDGMWAEDGHVFVTDTNADPLHETVFRSYAGYSHLLPRLLVVPTRYLPVEWLGFYVALAGAVVGALVGVFVFRASGGHVRDTWARLALAAACVLSPVLTLENEVTIVNLFWVVTFATFWAIVSRQERTGDVVARAVVAFLGVASSPIAGLFLPLVAVLAWTRRRTSDLVVAGAYLAGLALQILVTVRSDDPSSTASTKASDFVTMYAVRVLDSAVLGERGAMDLWVAWGWTLTWVTLALAACAVAAAVWRRLDPGPDLVVLVALAYSVALWTVPVLLRGSSLSRLVEGSYNGGGTRYFVTPVLLVVTIAAVICASASRTWMAKALLAQVVVVGVASLAAGTEWRPDWRPDGPSWIQGVRLGETACVEESRSTFEVSVAPGGPWFASLPCSRFTG